MTGLRRNRRLVLPPTVLDWPPELIEQVVAHTLGHWHYGHLRRQLLVVVAMRWAMLLVAWVVLGWDPLLSAAGVARIGDPASLPLLVAVMALAVALSALPQAWLRRADERQADLFALEVLRRPDRVVEVLRRLVRRNRLDLASSPWKRLTSSHPPVEDRLEQARRWGNQASPEVA